MEITLKIYRFNPEREEKPHYDIFRVEANSTDRILDCLNKIRWEQDGSLSYRMSCAHGICGSDGMTINGVSALACQKLVKDYDNTKEIVIEPLQFFPVIKDLIVDLGNFFERERSIHPPNGIILAKAEEQMEHTQTIQDRAQFDDDLKCIMCACCVASCPVDLKEDQAYVGPAAVVRAHRYIFDSRVKDQQERMKIMDKPHGIWSCKSYFKCTEVCPKSIKVTKHILEIKRKMKNELDPEKNRSSNAEISN